MRQLLPLLFVAMALLLAACVSPSPVDNGTGVSEPVAPTVIVQNVTPPSPVIVAPPADSACASAANILQKDDCYLKLASSQREVSWCDRIYSTDVKDQCLNAFSSSDVAICDRLIDSNLRQDCYEAAAHRLNATDYCVKLSNATRKLDCLKSLSPPCSFEPTDDATQLCQALVKSDYTLCHTNACFFSYAISRNDTNACALISGERAQLLACKALVLSEPNRCNDDHIQPIADYCLQIASYVRNSSNWCDLAGAGSTYRNDCYTHFAILNADPSYCHNAYPESSADECYLNYSLTLDAPAVCDQVVNSLNRNRCLIYTARNNGDPSACNGLLYSDRSSCYNIVLTGATPISRLSQCDAVNTSLWQDKCYLTYAQQRSDVTACAKISDPVVMATCQSRLA